MFSRKPLYHHGDAVQRFAVTNPDKPKSRSGSSSGRSRGSSSGRSSTHTTTQLGKNQDMHESMRGSSSGRSATQTTRQLGGNQDLTQSGGWFLDTKLGAGAFGEVHKLKDRRGCQVPYVAKRVSVASEMERVQCTAEISTLARLDHENIIRYISFAPDPDDKNFYLIIMELASGGSIESELEKFGEYDDDKVWRYTRMILNGLAYIHSKNVIHRDIKGANILIDGPVVKLADFGVAKLATSLNIDLTMNVYYANGTANFMSPELLKLTAGFKKQKCGYSTDIWSLGCTVVQMLTGKPPNMYLSIDDLHDRAIKGEHPKYRLLAGTSAAVTPFLDKCFIHDPDQRPGAAALLSTYFKEQEASRPSKCLIS